MARAAKDVETLPAVSRLIGNGELTNFKPAEAKVQSAKINAIKEVAVAARDWVLLDQAVDAEIELQDKIVKWWDDNPGKRLRTGRGKMNADRHSFIDVKKAQEILNFKQEQVSRFRTRLQNPPAYRIMLRGPSWRKAMSEEDPTFGTTNDEWFTPEEYIEMVRRVLGVIDLDPASHKDAQKIVKAKKWYSKANDGLAKPWKGRVFLNPPYSQPLAQHFIDKLTAEFLAGSVTQAILLTHNATDTGWFAKIADEVRAICFKHGRINFYQVPPREDSNAFTKGQLFAYYGPNIAKFAEVFGETGFVAVPYGR